MTKIRDLSKTMGDLVNVITRMESLLIEAGIQVGPEFYSGSEWYAITQAIVISSKERKS